MDIHWWWIFPENSSSETSQVCDLSCWPPSFGLEGSQLRFWISARSRGVPGNPWEAVEFTHFRWETWWEQIVFFWKLMVSSFFLGTLGSVSIWMGLTISLHFLGGWWGRSYLPTCMVFSIVLQVGKAWPMYTHVISGTASTIPCDWLQWWPFSSDFLDLRRWLDFFGGPTY